MKTYAQFHVLSVLDGVTPVPACGSDSYLRLDGRRKDHLPAAREHALRQRRRFTHVAILRGACLRTAVQVGALRPLFHQP